MDEELVLLTSYFNLADGRRQDSAETFRVDPSVSSNTSPDGTAALYIVTESSATNNIDTRARRVATDTIAWEYAARRDEPPAPRLKGALRAAHESVVHEFDGHVTVGVSVIAIEGDTVYLGQVGPAQVYVLHDASLHSISAGIDGSAPFARSLGSRTGPRISVFRDQIGPEDVLALCSSDFHRGVDAEELRDSFAVGAADDIAESLLDLAREHGFRSATSIVIEAVPAHELEAEDGEPAPTLMEQVDTAVQALTGVGRMLWEEFRNVPPPEPSDNHRGDGHETVASRPAARAATMEAPPEEVPPEVKDGWNGTGFDVTTEVPALDAASHAPTAPDASPNGGYREGMTEEVPLVPQERSSSPASIALDPEAPANGSGLPVVPEEEVPISSAATTGREVESGIPLEPSGEASASVQRETDKQARRRKRFGSAHPLRRPQARTKAQPDEEPSTVAAPHSELDEVNSRLQASADMDAVMPPVQAFNDTSTVEPSRIYATSKDIDAVNRRPRRFGKDGVSSGPRVIRPGDNDIDLRRPIVHSTPPALIWLSAVVILLLVAGGIFVYLRHRHTPVATVNPYPALARQDIAAAAKATNPADQALWLSKASRRIRQARATGVPAATIAHLRASYQSTSDAIQHVIRVVNPTALGNFASITGARPSEIAALAGEIYVLDQGRNSVFSISTTNNGATSGPSEISRSGDSVSTLTVGNPTHITADTANGGTAIILDDKNQIIRNSSTGKTATTLGQPSQAPMHPVAIATSDPDVYLLDPGSNQVWRYPVGVSEYNPVFQAYFDIVKPNLTKAVSFVLDGADLYVLSSDGTIQKFDYQEHPQPFTIAHLPTPLIHPTSIFTAPGMNSIWVADAASRRVVELDKSGNYIRSYESGSPSMHFTQLKSFAVAPSGNTMYVLTASQIFGFPIKH